MRLFNFLGPGVILIHSCYDLDRGLWAPLRTLLSWESDYDIL